jgi:hypothetical protein
MFGARCERSVALCDKSRVVQPLLRVLSLQSIHRKPQLFTAWNFPLIGIFIDSRNRFLGSLGVELLIAPCSVHTRLAPLRLRGLRRLPAWKFIVLGNGRDCFFRDRFPGFCFVVKTVASARSAKALTRTIHAAPATADV